MLFEFELYGALENLAAHANNASLSKIDADQLVINLMHILYWYADQAGLQLDRPSVSESKLNKYAFVIIFILMIISLAVSDRNKKQRWNHCKLILSGLRGLDDNYRKSFSKLQKIFCADSNSTDTATAQLQRNIANHYHRLLQFPSSSYRILS